MVGDRLVDNQVSELTMVRVKRKDGPGTEEVQQKHRALPEWRPTSLFASPAILSGPFLPVPGCHSSRIIAEPSTPGYSTTMRAPLDRQSKSWPVTPPSSTSSGSSILPPSSLNSPTVDCGSHLACFSFESAEEQTKIMEETLPDPDTPTSYSPYLPVNFTSLLPYSETSSYQDIQLDAVNSPAGGTETSRSQSPLDLPYCPSPCFLCEGVRATDDAIKPLHNTLNDWLVHFWKMHEDSSLWTTNTCVWKGCKTTTTFASVKLWLEHVRIVHYKSFYCERADCKIRLGSPNAKPFGSRADLNRHDRSTHATPIYCDKRGCTGREKLNRSDKRSKHEVDYHGQKLCIFKDCPRSRHVENVYYGFSTQDDLIAHLRDKHHFDASNGNMR